MGLKKNKKPGLFRGETPKNVFQTVDIGTGKGGRLWSIAKKFQKRKYAAVDPEFWDRFDGSGLNEAGVLVSAKTALGFIEEMKQRGLKTRHMNVDMPSPPEWVEGGKTRKWEKDLYNFKKIFQEAQYVLLPNGKIFIKTEDANYVQKIKQYAEEAGLKTRPIIHITGLWEMYKEQLKRIGKQIESVQASNLVPPLKEEKIEQLRRKQLTLRVTFSGHPVTNFMAEHEHFYLLEITFGLKKAFPEKSKRKNWPRTRKP